jgi:hypothetical protein
MQRNERKMSLCCALDLHLQVAPYQPNLRNEADTQHFEDDIADEVSDSPVNVCLALTFTINISHSLRQVEYLPMLLEIPCWRTRSMGVICLS